MRRLKDKKPVYYDIAKSPRLSTTRTNSISTMQSPKVQHSRINSEVNNFLRFGTPADTIVHVPLSVARLNSRAQKDLTRAYISFESLMHPMQPKRREAPVLEHEDDYVNLIKSVSVPIQNFHEVRRARPAFCISPKELSDSERMHIDIMKRIRVESTVDTQLTLSEEAKRCRDTFLSSVASIQGSFGGPIERAKRQSTFQAFNRNRGQNYLEAVKGGNLTTVKLLLASDKKLVYVKDSIGQTALHWAAKRNNVEMGKVLKAAGAEVDPVDMTLRTPLFLAARRDMSEMVDFLLEMGANRNIASLNGKTPATVAKEGTVAWALLNRRTVGNVVVPALISPVKRSSFLKDLPS